MKMRFFYFFALIGVFLVRDLGEAQSLYDELQQDTAAIPQEWRRERLPTSKATQTAQNVISLTHSQEKVSPTRKATHQQFDITGKALVASTLYDIRWEAVEKKNSFKLSPSPLNASSQFITHLAIVDTIILGTREIHRQILERLSQPFGEGNTLYPFDQIHFRAALNKNVLAQVPSASNKGYIASIQKALGTAWFVQSLFRWFEECDSQYDVKNVEDLKKEVTAIEGKRKGSRVDQPPRPLDSSYKIYKNEFGQEVGVFKPNNPKYSDVTPSTVRENENFRLVEQIIPGGVAPNYVVGREGMIEQFIPFVDRSEARFLLLNAGGKEGIARAYFNLCKAFQTTAESILEKIIPEGKIKDADSLINVFQDYWGRSIYTDQHHNLYKRISKNSFYQPWTLVQWLHPIISTVYDSAYWQGHLNFDRTYNLSPEEYKKYDNLYPSLTPFFQAYQKTMKNFAQEITKNSPQLGQDIYNYLCIIYMLQVRDSHAGNVMLRSVKGQLKFRVIDTELSHGVGGGALAQSPDILMLLPPFKGGKIDPSWKKLLVVNLTKAQGGYAAFKMEIVKQKATTFLNHSSLSLCDLYKSLMMGPRYWREEEQDFPYTLPRLIDYIIYKAHKHQESPLYV